MTFPPTPADWVSEVILRPVFDDPAGAIERLRREVHTAYFLRRFHEHRPEVLADLLAAWRPRVEEPRPFDSPWLGEWLERYGLPDTKESRQEVLITVASWRDWLRDGQEPPLKWWPDCARYSSLPPMEEGRRSLLGEEPRFPVPELRPEQRGWPPGPFRMYVVPGWESRESEPDFRARAEREFKKHLRAYLEAAKLFRKAWKDQDLLLAEPSSETRSQLDLLAEYQAVPGLSMKALAARKPRCALTTIRYRLHQAADLIGLPYARLNHASGTPKSGGRPPSKKANRRDL